MMAVWQEGILIALLLGALIASYLIRKIPKDLIFFIAAMCCSLFGIIPAKELMRGIVNEATLTLFSLYLIAVAMAREGLFRVVEAWTLPKAGESFGKRFLSSVKMGIAGAFLNHEKLPFPRRLVLLGGLCTLMGAPLNLIINQLSLRRGSPFGFFEYGKIGFPLLLLGALLLLSFGLITAIRKRAAKPHLTRGAKFIGACFIGMVAISAGGISLAFSSCLALVLLLCGKQLAWREIKESFPWQPLLFASSAIIFSRALDMTSLPSSLVQQAPLLLLDYPILFIALLFLCTFFLARLFPVWIAAAILFSFASPFVVIVPIKVIAVTILLAGTCAFFDAQFRKMQYFKEELLLSSLAFILGLLLIPLIW